MSTPAGGSLITPSGTRTRELPFSSIRGQSKLFIDLQSGTASAADLFPVATDLGSISENCGRVLRSYTNDRGRLVAELAKQNEYFGMTDAVRANLEMLTKPETVAVVTGQQAGLFTGPVFTIYKALTAIRMAEKITEIGRQCVPVFWIASEDHDIDEVRKTTVTNGRGELTNIELFVDPSLQGLPVGNYSLGTSISNAIDTMVYGLQGAPFLDEVAEMVRASWSEKETFATAFGRGLASLLGRFGVIMIDPMSPAVRQMAAPTIKDAITRSDEIIGAVLAANGRLRSSGYHTQVEADEKSFPLFRFDDNGKRRALKRIAEDEFKEKESGRRFSRSELVDEAMNTPERFSPSVLLRPIVQDALLPTACYVGGAAEISYFAQIAGIYNVMDRPNTPVIHRASMTIVEQKQRKLLDRLGINVDELFEPADALRQRLSELGSDADLATLFAETEEHVNSELNRLDQRLSAFDPTLSASLARRRQRMIYHIATLRKKALIESGRRSELLGNRLDALYTELLPKGGLQERTVNVYSLIARHGLPIIDEIYGAIDPEVRGHVLLELSR